MNLFQHALRFLIRLYQIFLSPVLGMLLGPSARCRFRPSCSEYARQAIATHGVLRGCWLALCRLGRCHPWGKSGDDPVPPPVGRAFHARRSQEQNTSPSNLTLPNTLNRSPLQN